MKATIYDVTFTAREVDVPAACPKCKAPLLDADVAGLVQYSILDAEAFFVVADEDGFEVCDNGGQIDETDSYPTGYACRECGEMLVTSDVVLLDAFPANGKLHIREPSDKPPFEKKEG